MINHTIVYPKDCVVPKTIIMIAKQSKPTYMIAVEPRSQGGHPGRGASNRFIPCGIYYAIIY
jgi:hypothetical protein